MAANSEVYTYDLLRQDIIRLTGNTDPDFLGSINRFIRNTESRIGQLVKLPAYLKRVTFAIPGGTTTLPITTTPISVTDFISVSEFTISGYGIIEQKSTDFISEAYPDPTETGPPRYFAMQDDSTFLLGPTTDQSYSASLHYNGKWPSLVDLGTNPSTAGQQTFIAKTFETALLHGCLYYAYLFMRDKDSATQEKQEMMESLGLVTNFANGAANNQDAEASYTIKQPANT